MVCLLLLRLRIRRACCCRVFSISAATESTSRYYLQKNKHDKYGTLENNEALICLLSDNTFINVK